MPGGVGTQTEKVTTKATGQLNSLSPTPYAKTDARNNNKKQSKSKMSTTIVQKMMKT